jgi:hypothetical protein
MRRTAKSCAERQAASSRSKVPMWPGFHSGEQAAPDQTLHRNESVRCHAQFKEFVSDKQPQTFTTSSKNMSKRSNTSAISLTSMISLNTLQSQPDAFHEQHHNSQS